MKKRLLVFTIAAISSISAAHAQSSVTLFGVIDEGIAYTTNIKGDSAVKMANGIRWPTYWGLKGREDLGGGWNAIFNLQSAYNINTGAMATSGVLFGRVAQVGLASKRYGQVTIGRQGEFMNDFLYLVPESDQYLTTYSMAPGGLDRMAGGQLSNSIKYRSGPGPGFTFGVMYAFPTTGTGTAVNGYGRSFELRYITPVVDAIAVYTQISGLSVTPASAMGTSLFLGYQLGFGSTTAVPLKSLSVAALGISYIFGPATAVVTYTNVHMESARDSGSLQTLTLGGVYHFTPAFEFEGAVSSSRLSSSRWYQLVGTLDYFLSKRTDVYLAADLERTSGAGQTAELFQSGGPSSTSSQAIIQLGLKHYF
ncbi:porin [Caballeronia sp. ATUFL_M1_KS5A]|uniref:porin n=1 Tax=Caballeronia sp. ATUFL_M1_KS5A TaxID=2921778 RepID=UPI002028BCC5|nr:porin [Caballeronia sp. ATUFL_M1_KS5A]